MRSSKVLESCSKWCWSFAETSVCLSELDSEALNLDMSPYWFCSDRYGDSYCALDSATKLSTAGVSPLRSFCWTLSTGMDRLLVITDVSSTIFIISDELATRGPKLSLEHFPIL